MTASERIREARSARKNTQEGSATMDGDKITEQLYDVSKSHGETVLAAFTRKRDEALARGDDTIAARWEVRMSDTARAWNLTK